MHPNAPAPRPAAPAGRVVAVCAGETSLAKRPLAEARVTRHGVPGDVHFGETYRTPNGPVPNDRPITAIAAEAIRAACADLAIATVPTGGFGENLLVEGLGELRDLVAGDLLQVGGGDGREPSVVLEVSQQNAPCKRLCSWHPGMRDAMVGRRGVICTVRREGTVRPGDLVEVVRATASEPTPTPA
jgi:MOSC domain-containing protein YiiM